MSNALLTTDTTPTLTWTALASASQYQAQVAAKPNFATLENDQTGLGSATVTFTTLATGKHYWRFRALVDATRVADQTNATGAGTGNALRDDAARTYLGQRFIAAAGWPLCRVAVSLKKTSTPTGNLWAEIWSSSGGSPSAIIGAASGNLDVSTLTTSYVTYNLDFSAPVPLVAGTTYFVVLRGDFTVDGVKYVTWQTDAAGSYTSGAPFKADATPTWSTNGTPDHIFTTYYQRWGAWQPTRSFWVNASFAASYAPGVSVWALFDPDDVTDYYVFAIAPEHVISPAHKRRSQETNIQGDLLTEYIATRDRIMLRWDGAYVSHLQAAEMLRFYEKRKSLFLVGVIDYLTDYQERVWKVDFIEDPEIEPIAPGRNDFFKMVAKLQEAALT